VSVKNYHINIFYSEEDEGWIADVPDLEACSAFGETPEDALREVERAKQVWLQAARKEGKPVPSPRYRPAIYQLEARSVNEGRAAYSANEARRKLRSK
jgi:predicted RNase H-like HicB family nuclease